MTSRNDLPIVGPDQRQVGKAGCDNGDDSRVAIGTWVCNIDG